MYGNINTEPIISGYQSEGQQIPHNIPQDIPPPAYAENTSTTNMQQPLIIKDMPDQHITNSPITTYTPESHQDYHKSNDSSCFNCNKCWYVIFHKKE